MNLKSLAVALCVVAIPAALTSAKDEPKPPVSNDPFTAEQLAVYHAVISEWMGKELTSVNLADQTRIQGEWEGAGGEKCWKGLDLEPNPTTVHLIRPEDTNQIASGSLHLVDPDKGSKEVDKNDPGNAIRRGQPVDSAVANGFAHGLLWLNEIRFDKRHTHAIVSFGFTCGSLCGNGSTLILKKTPQGWVIDQRCSGWIS
jgi:hypothetical protein